MRGKFSIFNFQFSIKIILLLVTCYLLLFLQTTNYQLPTAYAQNPSCTTAVPRAEGLISTPQFAVGSKFGTSSGACIIDPKASFVPFKIPTYDELKSIYFDQAKTSTTPPIIQKNTITGRDATQADLNFNENTLLYVTQNLNLSGNPPATALKPGVVFVNGNLNISSNYTYGSLNHDRGTVFVVNGNVNFSTSGSLTSIDGIIISSGVICTASPDFALPCPVGSLIVSPANQLNIYGSLISLDETKLIRFRRSLGAADGNTAAEKINQQVKYLVILKDFFSSTYQKWSEVTGPFTLPTPGPTPGPTPTPTPAPSAPPAPTPPQYIGSTTAAIGSPTSTNQITLTKPTGVQTGDLMIAQFGFRSSIVAFDPSHPNSAPGWTQITPKATSTHNSLGADVIYKVATSSEPVSYTFRFTGATVIAGIMVAYSGVNNLIPIDAYDYGNSTASPVTIPSITTITDNDVLLLLGYVRTGADIIPPTGMTEKAEMRYTSGGLTSEIAQGDNPIFPAGPTGTRQASSSTSLDMIGQLIALKAKYPVADDSDQDGIYNAIDCAPSEITRWRNLSCYTDADNDTRTIGGLIQACTGSSCESPGGYRSVASAQNDCDDSNQNTYQNLMCYTDSDNDESGTGTASNVCSGATCGANLAGSAGDCHDGNATVKPSQTGWFATAYTLPGGGTSFDYNCSFSEEKRFNTQASGPGTCYPTSPPIAGYTAAPPACGVSASYLYCGNWDGPSCTGLATTYADNQCQGGISWSLLFSNTQQTCH